MADETIVLDPSTDREQGISLRGLNYAPGGTPRLRLLLHDLETDELRAYSVTAAEFAAELAAPPAAPLDNFASLTTSEAIDMTDSFAYFTNDHVLVRRESGFFDRYDWDLEFQDRVAAERGTGKAYAFSPDGSRMYRFDPDTYRLHIFETWWQ